MFKSFFSNVAKTLKFIQDHFKAMIFLLIVVLIFLPKSSEDLTPNNLEEIRLSGTIMDANEVVDQIDKARVNDHIKGILLNIDSPGGAVAPSIEIAEAIKRAKKSKPVVVYASGTLASGSYYASIWADKIVANKGSMVGSIGVIIQGANIESLLEKVGVKTQSVQAGEYKQVGRMDREWSRKEKEELEKVIDSTYATFVEDVAEARGLDPQDADTFANAHIFTASQAKDVGLVDTIGVKFDAQNLLAELSGVEKAIWNKEDKIEKIFKKLTSEAVLSLSASLVPQMVLK
ncbi:MAG: signal peptide peptidase SppA [Sulfuricurvum sp.]